MSEQYYAEDVDQWCEENDSPYSNEQLLLFLNPDAKRRFNKACKELIKLLKEVNQNFPDAEYFVEGESGLHLILGSSHDGSVGYSKKNRIALSSSGLNIGGGAF